MLNTIINFLESDTYYIACSLMSLAILLHVNVALFDTVTNLETETE